jgi:hypothetical protein
MPRDAAEIAALRSELADRAELDVVRVQFLIGGFWHDHRHGPIVLRHAARPALYS